MSLLGGLVGVVTVGAAVTRRERLAVLPLLDMVPPGWRSASRSAGSAI